MKDIKDILGRISIAGKRGHISWEQEKPVEDKIKPKKKLSRSNRSFDLKFRDLYYKSLGKVETPDLSKTLIIGDTELNDKLVDIVIDKLLSYYK